MLWFLLAVFSYSHLNHPQLDPFGILLQLPSPFCWIRNLNLFLVFILEMTTFNDVETGSCSSEMLSLMSWRSSIISVLNSRCSLWPFCLKFSNWIFLFFSAGSLSLFFLIWLWISWNLKSKKLKTMFKGSLCPVTSSSSSCVSATFSTSCSTWLRLFNPWFGLLALSSCLDELATEISIWFYVSVLSVSQSNIAWFAFLETQFLRNFIVFFVFQSSQNLSEYWTTYNRTQTEKRLK